MANPQAANGSFIPEITLEQEIPICDAHHHILDTHSHYLLDAFLADVEGGHNIVKTVAVECGYKYRTSGPAELQPIGETEF